MTKEEVWEKGWNWRDEDETSSYHWDYYTPLTISHYDETKTNKETVKQNIDACISGILKCEVTWKPFKIIKQELAFYIENSIPLPTKCPDQRHKERMALRNPRKLYDRKCMNPNCKTPDEPMYTTYAPDREETVYCEECYRDEVYA